MPVRRFQAAAAACDPEEFFDLRQRRAAVASAVGALFRGFRRGRHFVDVEAGTAKSLDGCGMGGARTVRVWSAAEFLHGVRGRNQSEVGRTETLSRIRS